MMIILIENLHIDSWRVKDKDGKSVPHQTQQSHHWHQHSLVFVIFGLFVYYIPLVS